MKEKYSQLVDFSNWICEQAKKIGVTSNFFEPLLMVRLFAKEKGLRSHEQLSLYWGSWIPAILYHFPESIGKPKNREEIHNYLKFAYCFTKRQDLLQESRCVDANGKASKTMIPFSSALDKLPQKDMNDYLNFVKEFVNTNIGNFEKVVNSEDA